MEEKMTSETTETRDTNNLSSGNDNIGTSDAGSNTPEERLKGLPKRIRRFCRFILGLVFTVSGLLKLLDPVGTGLIVDSYFDFMHLGFMSPLAKIAGVLLAFTETFTGICLTTGVWRKITAIVTSSMLAIFTIITVILVIADPIMDCGCFGEAVHLSHEQSLLKNIILGILAVAAFCPLSNLDKPKKRKYVAFGLAASSALFFGIYSIISIPLINYTAFKPGARLMVAAEHNDDAYKAAFIYEKDGKRETFTIDNLPDSTWTFIDTETSISDSDIEEIPVLSLYDADGNYMDGLTARGPVMLISVYKKLNAGKTEDLADFYRNALEAGYSPLIVAASEGLIATSELPVYYSDYKTLLSMNRSNGGATYFYEGYLVKKWGFNSLPDATGLQETISASPTELVISSETAGSLIFQALLLYIFSVMLLL